MRPPSAAAARGVIAGAVRWLRSDLGDTVRVVRSPDAAVAAAFTGPGTVDPAASVAPPAEIGPGLHRWSERLRRRRSVVVARRTLLVVLPVALIVAIVIL